ncbi:hypothetical protein OGAPHI_003161 [Ogataea philodendri]|uniref:Major facilitator superfamily (MFS) profile domain-containing protein n=1 Tax=Ogataea philodendri TaxID=1378263 RepID=A0A9P8PA02_9ASCO|nr:uncharacterized protein OGAPHI_003161 [Ogataea philodendri]KAH3667512.1 hypothetical protein OGAPHI_003161 [Ogataea philodendri]
MALSKHIPKTQKSMLVVNLMMAICFPTSFGYDSMMMSSLNALPMYKDYFGITDATSNLNTASMWIGQIVSVFIVQYFADRFGRRPCAIGSMLIVTVGIILQSAAQDVAMFVIGRIVLGFGFGIGAVSVSVLIAELTPRKWRTTVTGLFFTNFLIGSIIASAVTYGSMDIQSTWCWRLPSIVQAAPLVCSFIFVWFSPESPRFLVLKGRENEAREILSIVEDTFPTSDIVEDIVSSCAEEAAINRSHFFVWKDIFATRVGKRRMLTLLIQSAVVEFGGSSVCSYYQSLLLEQAGITETKQKLQVGIVSTVWCLVWSILGSLSFDRLGRKPMAIGSLIGMIISFFIMGGLMKGYMSGANISPYGTVAMMFIFEMFYSFTYTPIDYLYSPEIWPTRHRAAGVAWYSLCNGCLGLLATFTLSIAMSNMSYRFYFVNAAIDIVFVPLVYFIWVETKGTRLEDVDALFMAAPYGGFGNSFFQRDDVEKIEVYEEVKS